MVCVSVDYKLCECGLMVCRLPLRGELQEASGVAGLAIRPQLFLALQGSCLVKHVNDLESPNRLPVLFGPRDHSHIMTGTCVSNKSNTTASLRVVPVTRAILWRKKKKKL